MPQTTDEHRAEWPGGDSQAIQYLEMKGFKLTKNWQWIKPYKDYHPTNKDNSALNYLCWEWDFGDVIYDHSETPDRLEYIQPKMAAQQQYALGLLAEEAGKIVQLVGKSLRFGFNTPGSLQDDGEPDFSNTPFEKLHDELGDICAAIQWACEVGLVERNRIKKREAYKRKKLFKGQDNLGRPLAPPLPDYPVRGPNGDIWEGKHLDVIVTFPGLYEHRDAIKEDLIKAAYKIQAKYERKQRQRRSICKHMQMWFYKSKEFDFG